MYSSFRKLTFSPYLWPCSSSTSHSILKDLTGHITTSLRKQSTFDNVKKDDYNSVWLKMCLSPRDVKKHETSAPVNPVLSYHKYKRTNCTLNDVKKKAYELFDTIEDLEYFDTEQDTWFPINKIPSDEVLQEVFKGRILNLRIPEYFDSFVIGDDDVFGFDHSEFFHGKGFDFAANDMHELKTNLSKKDNGTKTNYNTSDTIGAEYLMERLIRSLMKQLRENGYIRSNVKAMALHNIKSKYDVLTKEWVLRECNTSDELRAAILGNANALNHIVQCLHYDILWKDMT